MQSIQLKNYLDGFVRPENGNIGNVRAFTTSYQIMDNCCEVGDVFTNAGASGSVTFTLPTAKNGRVVRFLKQAQQTFVIKAGANAAGATAAKINGGAANGTYTNSAAENLKFVEVFSDGVDWFLSGTNGTWVTA